MNVDRISLLCRDMRHAWDQQGDALMGSSINGIRSFRRTLGCARCGTTRTDTYEVSRSSVERVRSVYGYPGGYRVRGGMSVGEARLLLFSDETMMGDA